MELELIPGWNVRFLDENKTIHHNERQNFKVTFRKGRKKLLQKRIGPSSLREETGSLP